MEGRNASLIYCRSISLLLPPKPLKDSHENCSPLGYPTELQAGICELNYLRIYTYASVSDSGSTSVKGWMRIVAEEKNWMQGW